MPEGPEVHNLAKTLNDLFINCHINNITINEKSRYYKSYFCGYDKIKYPLIINNIYAKGKKIIFNFSNQTYLVSSLGMEGHWILSPNKHSGIHVELSKDNQNLNLYFDDQRHFGVLNYCLTQIELSNCLKHVGPDWLNKEVSLYLFIKEITNKRKQNQMIHVFLMNQKIFSGIGNYLKSEVLYDSKIFPFRTLSSLSIPEITTLYNSIIYIIYDSYNHGGTTIYSYVDPSGHPGKYILKIYNKSVDEFNNIIMNDRKIKKKKDRTTYWVPLIQI